MSIVSTHNTLVARNILKAHELNIESIEKQKKLVLQVSGFINQAELWLTILKNQCV